MGGKRKDEGQEQHKIKSFCSDLTKTSCTKKLKPEATQLPGTGAPHQGPDEVDLFSEFPPQNKQKNLFPSPLFSRKDSLSIPPDFVRTTEEGSDP